MQLEGYFDFSNPVAIRIKGTRVGIEHVLYEYIHRAQRPEEIDKLFDSINLEQVYATILYYLHNRAEVSAYVAAWIEAGQRLWEEQQRANEPWLVKLRERMASYKAAHPEQFADAHPA